MAGNTLTFNNFEKCCRRYHLGAFQVVELKDFNLSFISCSITDKIHIIPKVHFTKPDL